jgi:hypothetical protein
LKLVISFKKFVGLVHKFLSTTSDTQESISLCNQRGVAVPKANSAFSANTTYYLSAARVSRLFTQFSQLSQNYYDYYYVSPLRFCATAAGFCLLFRKWIMSGGGSTKGTPQTANTNKYNSSSPGVERRTRRFRKSEHKTTTVVRKRDALLMPYILKDFSLCFDGDNEHFTSKEERAREECVSRATRPGNQDKCSQVQSLARRIKAASD